MRRLWLEDDLSRRGEDLTGRNVLLTAIETVRHEYRGASHGAGLDLLVAAAAAEQVHEREADLSRAHRPRGDQDAGRDGRLPTMVTEEELTAVRRVLAAAGSAWLKYGWIRDADPPYQAMGILAEDDPDLREVTRDRYWGEIPIKVLVLDVGQRPRVVLSLPPDLHCLPPDDLLPEIAPKNLTRLDERSGLVMVTYGWDNERSLNPLATVMTKKFLQDECRSFFVRGDAYLVAADSDVRACDVPDEAVNTVDGVWRSWISLRN